MSEILVYEIEELLKQESFNTSQGKSRSLSVAPREGKHMVDIMEKYHTEVVSISDTLQQVRILRKELKDSTLKPLILHCDYDHTPLRSDHFDRIWLLTATDHTSKIESVLKELYRVAKSGGILTLTDRIFHDLHPDSKILKEEMKSRLDLDTPYLEQFKSILRNSPWKIESEKDVTPSLVSSFDQKTTTNQENSTLIRLYNSGALRYYMFRLIKEESSESVE